MKDSYTAIEEATQYWERRIRQCWSRRQERIVRNFIRHAVQQLRTWEMMG